VRLTGLWSHPGFVRLWAAQSVSQLGSQVSQVAVPLIAVLALGAGAGQMGLLRAAAVAPIVLFGLVAGAWVDRLPRRSILIAADLGRAVLLGWIPLAAVLGVLRLEQLFAVVFLTGTLTILFNVAYESLLPSLVARDQLVDGNSKLAASASVAQVAGPGLAGVLVQAITAPLAVAVDAASFVVSAAFIGRIAAAGPARGPAPRRRIWSEIGEGLRVMAAHPILRAIALCACLNNLFGALIDAVYVLYVSRELALAPAAIGLVFGSVGVGAVVGSATVGWATDRLGIGRGLVAGVTLLIVARLCAPLAGLAPGLAVPLLVAGQFVVGWAFALLNVTSGSLRQSIVPDRLRGRVGASARTVATAAMPVGALLGGGLGEIAGPWPTLALGAVGTLLVVAAVVLSPLPALREAPEPIG